MAKVASLDTRSDYMKMGSIIDSVIEKPRQTSFYGKTDNLAEI